MKRPKDPVKAKIEQAISPDTPRTEQAVSTRVTRTARALVVLSGLAAAGFLAKGWWDQSHAPLVCQQGFTSLAENNNSYIQINIVAPHQVEQDFNAEFFLFYPNYESPPDTLLPYAGRKRRICSLNPRNIPYSMGWWARLAETSSFRCADSRRVSKALSFGHTHFRLLAPLHPTSAAKSGNDPESYH